MKNLLGHVNSPYKAICKLEGIVINIKRKFKEYILLRLLMNN